MNKALDKHRKSLNKRQLLHSAMYLIRSILKDDYVLRSDPKVIKNMLEDAYKDIILLNDKRIESKLW